MDTLITAQAAQITYGQALETIGARANEIAERAVFALYQDRRPVNTQRSQRAALGVFSEFMRSCGIATPDLYADPWAWQGITWGLVQSFQLWLLQAGYSMKTINDRVSVVKVYMGLANQAGIVPDSEIIRLRGLRGYTQKEAVDMDRKRKANGLQVRKGTKKDTATPITEEQARALKVQPDTPQGRRDALLMGLLLDHGLRVSEVAGLQVENVNREKKQFTFYRPKTGRTSRHTLRGKTWHSMVNYLDHDQRSQSGTLLLQSTKSGALVLGSSLTERAINQRVKHLGQAVGIETLSPHDCRHYGATKAANDPKVSLAALMAWGGWSSPQSAAHYIDRGQSTDNDGVSLGME